MRGFYHPRKKYYKSIPFGGKCEHCNKKLTPKQAICYVDETNASINYNSPYLCYECYIKKYGSNSISLMSYLINLGFNVDVDVENKILIIDNKNWAMPINRKEIFEYYKL